MKLCADILYWRLKEELKAVELHGAGSVVAMVIGNAFVMGLEGFIVGIQVLRLEFYEMFGHYFDGQGTPFEPLALKE